MKKSIKKNSASLTVKPLEWCNLNQVADVFHGGFEFFDTVTVGERGQVVIPVQIRKKLKLKSGQKLLVAVRFGKIMTVFKASELESLLKEISSHLNVLS